MYRCVGPDTYMYRCVGPDTYMYRCVGPDSYINRCIDRDTYLYRCVGPDVPHTEDLVAGGGDHTAGYGGAETETRHGGGVRLQRKHRFRLPHVQTVYVTCNRGGVNVTINEAQRTLIKVIVHVIYRRSRLQHS